MKTLSLDASLWGWRGEMGFARPSWLNAQATDLAVVLMSAADARAESVRSFIHKIFYSDYHADVQVTYPYLLAAYNKAGHVVAALGFRQAGPEKIFLENYLDQPVEQVLTKPALSDVQRSSVVELGNVASTGEHLSKYLFAVALMLLEKKNFSWIVSTITARLTRGMKRLCLEPVMLAKANPRRLEDKGFSWGTYYAEQPEVYALSLPYSLCVVQQVWKVSWTCY